MIETIRNRDNSVAQFLIRPNRSITSGRLLLVLGLLSILVAGVGLYFMSVGAWLVLPFSGLEILLIAFVAYELTRQAGDHELIEFDRDRVQVTQHRRGIARSFSFQRYWLQIEVRCQLGRWGGQKRLYLRSHGREYEVGLYLCDSDRLAVAARLRELIQDTENERL